MRAGPRRWKWASSPTPWPQAMTRDSPARARHPRTRTRARTFPISPRISLRFSALARRLHSPRQSPTRPAPATLFLRAGRRSSRPCSARPRRRASTASRYPADSPPSQAMRRSAFRRSAAPPAVTGTPPSDTAPEPCSRQARATRRSAILRSLDARPGRIMLRSATTALSRM